MNNTPRNEILGHVLKTVQKPARYVGGEYNQIVKDKEKVNIRVAYCFPDTYEIGMSNLGLQIMYGVLNSLEDVWCERVFAPWSDMEERMREEGIALFALESGDALSEFDMVAFSIGFELSYTNILNMLSLAKIPLRAKDRAENAPLIIAGGMCCYNPEPLAEFFDLFVIGEGEQVAAELIDLFRGKKKAGISKHELLSSAAEIPGIYVPALYGVCYNEDNTIKSISPKQSAKFPVEKRIIKDLDNSYYPVNAIIPSMSIVHDRVSLELFRGCRRGCKFCQAGHVTGPVRARKPETLIRQGIDALKNSGYNEVALLSLSSSDYEGLGELCEGLIDWCEPRNINLSLPSLRADNFSMELLEKIQKVRKSGLTFAPEAGSQRLRDVINKNITEEDLLKTCEIAFGGGYNSIKLYFMLGLPTETDEDVIAIAELSRAVLHTWKKHAKNKSRGARITISTSCFVPKPHTPFQKEPQITIEEYLRRVKLLKDSLQTKAITYNWHDPQQGFIEAVLSRGDRKIGDVIEAAFQSGARLDSWSEHFSFDKWLAAFEKCGIDPAFYAHRTRKPGEILPWSVVSAKWSVN